MSGLREVLIDEIERVRSGQSSPAQAKSVAMLAKTALESIHTEISLRTFAKDNPDDGKPLALTHAASNDRQTAPIEQPRRPPPANRSIIKQRSSGDSLEDLTADLEDGGQH